MSYFCPRKLLGIEVMKLLLCVFSVLFYIGTGYMSGEVLKGPKHYKWNITNMPKRRDIFLLSIYATCDNLMLVFNRSVKNGNIIIRDNNGKEVYNESNMMIEDGETLIVEDTGNFPYMVEIHSAAGSIIGEIIVEDM